MGLSAIFLAQKHGNFRKINEFDEEKN